MSELNSNLFSSFHDSNDTCLSAEQLQYALEAGMINIAAIQSGYDAMERKKYLGMHPYKIWQDKNGNYYTYFPDDERGRVQKKRKNKKDMEDLIISFWKNHEEVITVEDAFIEYNDRRLELGQIGKATHSRNRDTFKRHFEEFGKRNIKKISPEDVDDFLVSEISRLHLTAKAFANLKSLTKGILKRAKKRKLIDFDVSSLMLELDVSDAMFKKKVKNDKKEVFDDDEFKMIISYLFEHLDLWNLGILLIFFSGLRVGELVALKWEDVDLQHNLIHVCRTETCYKNEGKHTKTYEVKDFPKTEAGIRTIIIPKDYAWILTELRKINPFTEYIFMNGDHRLSTNSIRKRLYNICDKLGIDHKSPHKGRKTYASILLDNGIDQNLITEMMGHTDISCTENYYHRNRKSIEEQAQIINDIPEFKAK